MPNIERDENVYNELYKHLKSLYDEGEIKQIPVSKNNTVVFLKDEWYYRDISDSFVMLEEGKTKIVVSKSQTVFARENQVHCLTGPARMDYQTKTKEFWIKGVNFSEKDFWQQPEVINHPTNIENKIKEIEEI